MRGSARVVLLTARIPPCATEALSDGPASLPPYVFSFVRSLQPTAPPTLTGTNRVWNQTTRRRRKRYIVCGVQPNRVCACCGSAMESNTASRYCIAIDYCCACHREPLCGACAWPIPGWPAQTDVRRARLIHAAALTEPRTAAGVEQRHAFLCCQCRGAPNPEHEHPEQPLPVAPGRQEGWRPCPQCELWIHTIDDGSRILRCRCRHAGYDSSDGSSACRTLAGIKLKLILIDAGLTCMARPRQKLAAPQVGVEL